MVMGSYLADDYQEREEEELRRQAALAPAPTPLGYGGGSVGGSAASTIPGYTPVAPPEPIAPSPSPVASFVGEQMAQPPAPVFGPPVPPPQYGDPYVDAPTGSLRAQLEANRQGESQYANAALALGVGLPIIASGPVAGPLGVIGSEIGNVVDERLGTPEIPIVGGPFGFVGGAIGGGIDPGAIGRVSSSALSSAPAVAARGAFDNVVRAGLPEPTLNPGFAAGLNPQDARAYLISQGISPDDVAAFERTMNVSPPGTIENAAEQARTAARDAYNATGQVPDARAAAASAYDTAVNQPPPLSAGPTSIVDDAYDSGQAFGYNPSSPDYTALPPREPFAQLTPEMADELRLAQEIADEDALYARTLTGGGVAPGPTAVTPPPASAPEIAGLLPERASPNFTTVGEPYPTPTPSQRVDELMAQTRTSSPTPTFPMTVNEAIAEADRIGFPIDRDALTRGTPLAQRETLDRLSAAIDLHNFKNGYSSENAALENFVRTAREQTSGPIRPEVPPASVSTPPQRAAWDTVMDLLYAPLSGDAGSGLRQLFSSMMNPLNLRLNSQVVGDAIKGASSRAEALDVLRELDSLKAAADARIGGKNIDLHRPDIPGVRETRGLANRETLQSNTLGNIPGLGAYFNITGRGNALLLDSSRVRDYVRFIDALPDRALVGDRSLAHWQAQAQSYADMKAVMSGRGSLGSGKIEDALSKAGPLFTSLRYALSIPQRVPYLVPVQRIADGSWEVFGPQWREAVKEHAGYAATLAGVYAAVTSAGAEIDKDSGRIKVGGQTFDLTGGAGSYWKLINDVAGGNYKALADFTRNKLGPLPQAVAAGAKEAGFEGAALDYMRPDWFDQGATGTGLMGRGATTLDRVGQYIVPLWIQDVAKAARAADLSGNPSLPAAAVAGLSSFFGVSTRSNVTNPRAAAINKVVDMHRDKLPEAYRDQITKWNEATPKEQQAMLANASPGLRDAIAKAEQTLRDRKDVFQLSRDEEKARDDLATENRKVAEPFVQKLQEDWLAGRIDPGKAIDLLEKAEKAADAEARMTSNMGPKLKESPAYQDAIKNFSNETRALDSFYQAKGFYDDLYNSPSVRRADGTVDYNQLKAKQDKFWAAVEKEDPALAARLRFNVQPDPANNFEFTNAIKALDDKIRATGYYAAPEGTKTQFRRENPQADAMMALKYGGPVRSQAAADMLKRIAPERQIEIRK